MDLSSATFMDDISRIQIFAAPPSVAEVVFKMNRAHSTAGRVAWRRRLDPQCEQDSKCHHDEGGGSERHDQGADRQAKRAARYGLLGGTTPRTLLESEWTYHGRNWKESYSGAKRMETMRQVPEGKRYRRG